MLTSIRGTQDCTSLMTRQTLLQFGWEVLIPPPYSPDISPSDFHLFQSLQNSVNGKNFNSLKTVKNHLEQFFAQKDKKFWEDGIMKLPEKWQKIVEKNDSTTILVTMLFNKVLGKNEKRVFYFYLKTERIFWPTQYFDHSFSSLISGVEKTSYSRPFFLAP